MIVAPRWALAWVLGVEQAPPIGQPLIDGDVFQPMLGFVPALGSDLEEYLASSQVRPEQVVKQLEAVFYSAHNAARSAQLGRNTVPKD